MIFNFLNYSNECIRSVNNWNNKIRKFKELDIFRIFKNTNVYPILNYASVGAKHIYMDPKCKVAMIVGGVSPLGCAIARELLCNDLYRVVITGKDTCKGRECVQNLNTQFGENKACFMILDVHKNDHFNDAMKCTIRVLGNLDIVVTTPPIFKMKNWEEEIDANILAAIRATSQASCHLSSQKLRPGGIIINVASAMAFDNFPNAPIHVSAANGIIGLSQAWGATPNYSDSNVRVVAVCPGITNGLPLDNTLSPNDPKHQSEIKKLHKQSASAVGKAVVYAVQHAPSGSVWIVDKNVLYSTNHKPIRRSYSQKMRYV